MQNKDLAKDYIFRAGNRLESLKVLLERKSFADVVREAQELIELCLKAVLRSSGVEVPRSHDVSDILVDVIGSLPATLQPHVKNMAKISKRLRRDRELSFYGSEDLTPSEFYSLEDAQEAFDDAQWIYSLCSNLPQ